MEKAIAGYDLWQSDERREKHILASQAKTLYADYWDNYFKFSFVRNPWDRMVSMAKSYPGTWHVKLDKSQKPLKISEDDGFKGYKHRFGYPITIERDRRFYKKVDLSSSRHVKNAVYLNLLDEDLDFVGRFENLKEDFAYVAKAISLDNLELPHAERKGHKAGGLHYSEYYTDKTKEDVRDLYEKDIKYFDYEF
tara:strand:- start:7781 stop:8362 length:582 start_codon:yes stop_codon:yes gene_type:complete